jgi:cyclopropane fatty-acyl-phospholipid synthase-like methyltransferase
MNFDPRDLLAIPKLYQLFANFVGSSNGRKRLVDEFLKTRAEDKILDVGCGPGSMREFLLCETYCGMDVSPKYISAARAQHGDSDRYIVRAVTDKTSFSDLGKFDLVIAIALLHHLKDAEAFSLFQAAKEVLNPGGRVVTLDNVFVPEQGKMARWIIRLDRGKYVRTKEAYVTLARQQFQDVRATILHDLIRIPYTHIVMECR